MATVVRVRFSIPVKLLIGFLANLALLVAGFWLVFHSEFGGVSGRVLAGVAEPRLQAVAVQISAALRERPPSEWTSYLQTQSEALGIGVSIFDADVGPLAGVQQTLPVSLEKQVKEKLAPHLRRPGFREGRPPPPPPPGLSPLDDLLGFEDESAGRRPPPPRSPPPMELSTAVYPSVMLHTTDPSAYWAVVRVPAIRSDWGWLPVLLVMRSDTITGGGLFFDPKPWIAAAVGVLLLSGCIWLPLALNLTRSLLRLRAATGRIAEGDFAVPVPDASRQDELGALGRSVQQMAGRLEQHVQGQKRFLGDIAHELCSPLARMQASLGILQHHRDVDEKSTRYLEKLATELQNMSTLVHELLSFSKAGLKSRVQLQSVELEPFVRSVAEREDLPETMLNIDVPAALAVHADPDLLARALGNLMRNARRYAGDAGPVEIRASLQEGEHGHVCMTVSDRGPGVPEETLPRLLEPFFRPDPARTRESGGAGLGLAIVKSCVEACGGGVEVANRAGGGLEVTLRLQRVAADGEAAGLTAAGPSATART